MISANTLLKELIEAINANGRDYAGDTCEGGASKGHQAVPLMYIATELAEAKAYIEHITKTKQEDQQ